MTNNEAEYAGLILALELALSLNPEQLSVYLDSTVVVGQMNGDCGVHAKALQVWHRKACLGHSRDRPCNRPSVPYFLTGLARSMRSTRKTRSS